MKRRLKFIKVFNILGTGSDRMIYWLLQLAPRKLYSSHPSRRYYNAQTTQGLCVVARPPSWLGGNRRGRALLREGKRRALTEAASIDRQRLFARARVVSTNRGSERHSGSLCAAWSSAALLVRLDGGSAASARLSLAAGRQCAACVSLSLSPRALEMVMI